MVLNFVKTEKTADFEAIIVRLKEALAKSDKPERKQQAASWKVFKAVEPGPPGSALYVFIVDPPVKGADYTVRDCGGVSPKRRPLQGMPSRMQGRTSSTSRWRRRSARPREIKRATTEDTGTQRFSLFRS